MLGLIMFNVINAIFIDTYESICEQIGTGLRLFHVRVLRPRLPTLRSGSAEPAPLLATSVPDLALAKRLVETRFQAGLEVAGSRGGLRQPAQP